MPLVPTTGSRMTAAMVCGALEHHDLVEVLASARSHSSASVVEWNDDR